MEANLTTPFTATDDPEIERQLRAELAGIVSLVRTAADGLVQALVLAGGFGRGEGGALRTQAGVHVVNDYDFIAIVRPRDAGKTKRILKALGDELETKTTAKQVDMAVVENWKLLVPSPSVARYEVKHGHRVLWGRVPYPIAAVPAPWLPLEEGTKYLRNRGSGLLIARLLLDGYGGFEPAQQAAYALIEIDKAVIAIGDAALIAAGRYHYLYQERRRRVLHGEGAGLTLQDVEAYAEAVERKVRPGPFSQPALSELATHWESVRSRFLAHALAFEQRRLRVPLPTIQAYFDYCTKEPRETERLFWSRAWSIEDRSRTRQIRLETFSLLDHYERVFPGSQAYRDWQGEVIRMLKLWHPEGIVARIVADYV